MTEPLTMTLPDFLKQCRRPLYYKSSVNKLKVHALLSLGGIRQCVAKHQFVYGQAYIIRDPKGWYRFVGLWTLPSKPNRPDVWVEGRFQLNKGQMMFEDSVTATHLTAFFKVCRYLGVHKRVEVIRYQQAYQAWCKNVTQRNQYREEVQRLESEYGLYHITTGYLYKRELGSWFLAEDLPPLFCGLILDGLKVKRYSHIKQDVRDRIIVTPLVAMYYKQEIRELNV
ncbi:hypothetical protein LQM11_004026 [Vibrio parahaemolyticus]|nr:hypothetical protein [Vibrio parahaemolyticus]